MAEKQTGNALRVGILMVVGIAILAGAIFSIGGGLRFLGGSAELDVRFKRINGLQTGAPVYLSGVNIGSVTSIEFPADPRANYVVVRIRIAENALSRVRTDSVAKIESLGLLGDKFLLLTSGSPEAPSVQPNTLLKSQSPVNYAALLQARGTGDLVANVIAISSSLRQILDTFNQGNGILAQLVKGSSNPAEQQLTLASLARALTSLQNVTDKLGVAVDRVNRGQGVIGAMLSPGNNGQQMVANISDAAASLRTASARLDETSVRLQGLFARIDRASGLLPQLMENRKYADGVMRNLSRSSADLREAMDKINSRQGTIGLLISDPALYDKTTNLVSANGWAFSLLRGMYSVSHPFSTTASPSYAPAPGESSKYSLDLGGAPPSQAGSSPAAPPVRGN
jgi:phospholipid/cholesterol/gamma-HCH transport system substrate-binding protein